MPYYRKRKRSSYGPYRRRVRTRRAKRALARTYLRKWVRRRRRTRRTSLKRLASGVRTLFKRSKVDNRFFYLQENNTLVENDTDWVIIGGKALNSIPNYVAGGDPMKMREQDNESAVVKHIRFRLQLRAQDIEAPGTMPYYVMLIKTSHQRGTIAGIQPCQPNEFFDYDATPPNMPRWDGFRLVSDNGQEILADTKVLWVKKGLLQPSGAYRARTVNYGLMGIENDVPAAGSINDIVAASTAPPGSDPKTIEEPGSVDFVPTRPNEIVLTHSHRCGPSGLLTKFEAVDTDQPIVESYFLLALGNQPAASRQGYRVSASIKVTFTSS